MAGPRSARAAARRASARFVAVALAAAGCANDATTHDLVAVDAVATQRAAGATFAGRTFAIVASVGVVSDAVESVPVRLSAPALIGRVVSHLEGRGYRNVGVIDPLAPPPDPIAADYAVNLTALDSDRTDPAHWLGSLGHAAPAAWGRADAAWAYRWEWVPIPLRRGTILVELAEITGAPPGGTAPVVWAALGYGVGSPETGYETQRVLEIIDRAFAQSSYLQAAP
jgi:hypothetical protein